MCSVEDGAQAPCFLLGLGFVGAAEQSVLVRLIQPEEAAVHTPEVLHKVTPVNQSEPQVLIDSVCLN